eukprot:6174177-Pleurochrysis_carterae.AAC.3
MSYAYGGSEATTRAMKATAWQMTRQEKKEGVDAQFSERSLRLCFELRVWRRELLKCQRVGRPCADAVS